MPAVAAVLDDITRPGDDRQSRQDAASYHWEPAQTRGFVWVQQPRVAAPGLNALLTWAHQAGASRISFQTGHPVMIRLYGQNRRVTLAALDEMQISVIVTCAGSR